MRILLVTSAFLLLLSCEPEQRKTTWTVYFQGLGTNSSPRATDLNGDGVLDIVMGAGKNEWVHSDTAVIALDGKNGALLWAVGADNQVVGSACFLDVTGDGTQDVFIGGRTRFLVGINGKTGQLLWQYQYPENATGAMAFAKYNFYSPQLVPDQNGDGLQDLLIANGGNSQAFPNSSDGREPGVLLLIDSKNGDILAAAVMPDSMETYMSPLVYDFDGDGAMEIVFGSGGETLGGSLYKAPLSPLKSGDLHQAIRLYHADGHGFIAPPVLADLNSDGILDIVANNQGGEMLAFDGKTNELLWKQQLQGTESSSSPAVGYFNADAIPDLFGHFSVGTWPDNKGAYQIAVDGRNGEILKKDSLGCTGFFSPIAFDADDDGVDEVLLSVNEFNCSGIFTTDIEHYLALYDINDGQVTEFSARKKVKNLSSTPWLGDMDGDGLLDLIHCVQANTADILEFHGMAVLRTELDISAKAVPSWGAYMGNKGNGIFEPRVARPDKYRD